MSTQGALASYQEIIDLHTESDRVSVIGIHTPVGDAPHRMFEGFFKQFKKFKYLGCSISFVPAARLPADPLQVSYEAGEPAIDPRDLLNPIMFHGCHGEDLGAVLNKLYTVGTVGLQKQAGLYDFMESDSAVNFSEINMGTLNAENMLEDLYYRALTDNTWKKAHPQKGFRKSGLKPMVYSLATTHQIMPGDLSTTVGPDGNDVLGWSTNGAWTVVGPPSEVYGSPSSSQTIVRNAVPRANQILTPRLTGLGWLDTYNVLGAGAASATFTTATLPQKILQLTVGTENMTRLPTLFMGVILLPPAYKCEQYFRMIITHHFAFKQFRGISYDPTYDQGPIFDWNNKPTNQLGSGDPSLGDPEPEEPTEPEFAAKYTVKEISADGHTVTISDGTQWVDMEANVPTGTVTPSITPAADTPFTLGTNATKKISCQFVANSGAVTCIWYPTLAHWSIAGTTNSSTSFETFGAMFTESGDNSDLAEYLNGVIENGTVVTFYDGE